MEVQNLKDTDSEEQNKLTMLNERIAELEAENKKIRDEFGVQRAKMKDLFLQKQEEFNTAKSRLIADSDKIKDELNELRSELCIAGMKRESDLEDEKRKANDEIASLEQLVHETVEESSISRGRFDSELRKLQSHILQLQEENRDLKTLGQQSSPHHSSQDTSSLAPSVMLSAVTKTLARKLGADTFASQENLEESMRRAQEDAEMLRSLVVPLEEEIKALKDKLRSTDDQLQKCRLCGHNPQPVVPQQQIRISATNDDGALVTQDAGLKCEDSSISNSVSPSAGSPAPVLDSATSPQSPPGCDMCSNYETQLQREQLRNSELEARLLAAEKGMERHKEDLLKEIGFRKDMEEKWNEKKEEHKHQVNELKERTSATEQNLHDLRRTFHEYSAGVTEQLAQLTREREHVHERLVTLQCENDKLVGKYAMHSQELQNAAINLPDTVEELQEKMLKLQEDIITGMLGKETAEEQNQTLQGDILLIRTQLSDIMDELEHVKMEKKKLETERHEFDAFNEEYNRSEKMLKEQMAELKHQVFVTEKSMGEVEQINNELRSRVASLQQELDNSEQVQKDFVMLSQSLQVQLEKIRSSDIQVRWQHEDDVDECPGCRSAFAGGVGAVPGKRTTAAVKHHCLHCGQVFCLNCLGRTVPSGPSQRAARVCDVCHTLLVKSSAPYFSTDPPQHTD